MNLTSEAQNQVQKDSLLKEMMNTHSTPGEQTGVTLINAGNYQSANVFLSNEISGNESNAHAYFQRGVANWAMSDTLSACRDWSAVLALGDTEMFNILESRCHSSMIIENDTIPAKKYKKMFRQDPGASATGGKLYVDKMPEFPGGTEMLGQFIFSNTKKTGDKHGTVYVNFMVSPAGKILFPYVAHGLGNPYDKEALRVIKSMPDWLPGKDKEKQFMYEQVCR